MRKKVVEQLVMVTRFIEAGRTHIAYEETQVWPSLRTALSAAEASEIGTKVEQGKKRPRPARTRTRHRHQGY